MPVIVPSADIYVKSISSGKIYDISKFRKLKLTLSRQLPCDQCELILPRLDSLKLFKENDEITINLGNDHVGMNTIYTGLISYISPQDEPILKAEDHFKIFKEKRNTIGFYDTPDNIAKDIIEHCGFEAVIPDNWDHKQHFYWKMQTAAEALEDLSQIGWDYFCIPATKKIYFGKPYCHPEFISGSRIPIYKFGLNIISSQLEYRTASPIKKVIVYVTDIKFRGKSIKVIEGEGEPVKIYNLQMDFDPSIQSSVNGAIGQATKFAKQQIYQSEISGYFGTFKTFGNPFVMHSQKIKIEDPEKQERNGHYYIDQVVHEFSPDAGYKMEITVGGSEEAGGTSAPIV